MFQPCQRLFMDLLMSFYLTWVESWLPFCLGPQVSLKRGNLPTPSKCFSERVGGVAWPVSSHGDRMIGEFLHVHLQWSVLWVGP